jgi:5'-3' exonuclease
LSKSFNKVAESNESCLMIVDALNLSFRYLHAKSTDFVDDYLKVVESLKKSYKASKVIITSDVGSSTYRKGLYPEYKQNRTEKYAEQTEQEAAEFAAFFEEFNRVLMTIEAEGVYPLLRFKGVEADDIAAYIVQEINKYPITDVWLISSDRDWDLLIGQGINRFSYVTRKEVTLDNWATHYDWDIDEYISIKCLMGDAGDNIKGVEGIGPKRAMDLIKEYGSAFDIATSIPISSKYKYIQSLNQCKDRILLNYQLMDLVTYCKDAIGADNCAIIDNVLAKYLV